MGKLRLGSHDLSPTCVTRKPQEVTKYPEKFKVLHLLSKISAAKSSINLTSCFATLIGVAANVYRVWTTARYCFRIFICVTSLSLTTTV